jgi:hypothetical protein
MAPINRPPRKPRLALGSPDMDFTTWEADRLSRLQGLTAAQLLDSANFTGTEWDDLTDAGETSLHTHDHGALNGLADDDHGQYILGDRADWELHRDVSRYFNGARIDTASATVTESGGTVFLNLEAEGGGDIGFIFDRVEYTLDCTPILQVTLTAGTDTMPQINYVYVTESLGVLSLIANTTGFPTGAHSPIAHVFVQSAAGVAVDGPFKLHGLTDHISGDDTGHSLHINEKLRSLPASWVSGAGAQPLVVSSPDAYLSVDAGVIYHLHAHTWPARDMQSGDPAWVVNDPTTPYLRITTLDDINQDALGGTINVRWFPLVVWGACTEEQSSCKLFINLPGGTYSTQMAAENDSDNYANYGIPREFLGVGFLIAKYIVQGQNSGAWVEGTRIDLRGLYPALQPAGGTAITDHGGLSGLGDDDHALYWTSARGAARVSIGI